MCESHTVPGLGAGGDPLRSAPPCCTPLSRRARISPHASRCGARASVLALGGGLQDPDCGVCKCPPPYLLQRFSPDISKRASPHLASPLHAHAIPSAPSVSLCFSKLPCPQWPFLSPQLTHLLPLAPLGTLTVWSCAFWPLMRRRRMTSPCRSTSRSSSPFAVTTTLTLSGCQACSVWPSCWASQRRPRAPPSPETCTASWSR